MKDIVYALRIQVRYGDFLRSQMQSPETILKVLVALIAQMKLETDVRNIAMKLFDHQNDVVAATRQALRSYRKVIIQAATGFGKTVIAAFMAKNASKKDKRLYFICHRAELVYQTHLTFNKVGIDHGFIASGFTPDYDQKIQICSIETLKRRLDKVPPPDICLWDEAHHTGAAGWAAVQAYYEKAFHIGLSATPWRLDGKGLGRWFDKMICGPSMAWLIENKFLSEYKIYAPSTPDLSGVHTRMGDFKQDELEAAVDNSVLVGNIVKHYLKYARGKKTILFAVSIKHSKRIVAEFKASGVRAVHLDGTTPKAERKQASILFAQGRIDVLCNVDLFGEGYDLAAQSGMEVNIEAAILARPTQSLSLFLQQCGRSLRYSLNKIAIILDHAGNTMRHGLPDDDRECHLKVKIRKRKKQLKQLCQLNNAQNAFMFMDRQGSVLSAAMNILLMVEKLKKLMVSLLS